MAEDFRKLLTEVERTRDGERWFEDIKVGNVFLSVQAGPYHESEPQDVRDPMEYAAFAVTLANEKGVVTYGKWGVWDRLKDKPWAGCFSPDRTTPSLLTAKRMPVDMIQLLYEDLLEEARLHPVA